MRHVLADLAIESEAATALAMRLAAAFDAQADERSSLLRRLLTPAAKYWICKRGPSVAAEAMEVLGGNGYVEEGPMARLYRQMPLNSIWEGSGNVMCLDVLRAIAKHPNCIDALTAEVAPVLGHDKRLDAFAGRSHGPAPPRRRSPGTRTPGGTGNRGAGARRAPRPVRPGFRGGRLSARHGWAPSSFGGGAFGNLPAGADVAAILDRAWPT